MFIFGYPARRMRWRALSLRSESGLNISKVFLKKSEIDTIQLLNAVPLPGSELRARLRRRPPPASFDGGWDKYDDCFFVTSETDGLDPDDLKNAEDADEKKIPRGLHQPEI